MAVKGLWQVARPLDRLIVLVLFAAALFGAWGALRHTQGAEVVVEQDGVVRFVAPLDRPARAEIPGPYGKTVVEVRDGAAVVVSATCPERLCMAMGSIRRQGDVIACLPNRVLVRIAGKAREQGYDLLSR